MRTPLLALILAASPAYAEPATVARVLDGDSVRVIMAGREVVLRLAGIDSPETHLCATVRPFKPANGGCAKCEREAALGQRAKAEAMRLLPAGAVVEVVRAPGRDRYGRLLARITLPNGEDYAGEMMRLGLAAPYSGRGKKPEWCR